jgi:inhibitor of KinA
MHQSGMKDIKHFLLGIFDHAYRHAAITIDRPKTSIIEIPVCYHPSFALDMEIISGSTQLSTKEIIRLHTDVEYTVYMIGFLPGFPYMGFVDDRIAFGRKSTPRAMVPAGSVGIAGKQTGIYPLDSPGGWQIIGRTPLTLFEPRRDPPVALEPGGTVRFFEVSLAEFESMSQKQ